MIQSFRARLAARFSISMFIGLLALSVMTFVVIRSTLDRQLNASLLNIASIQASSLTDAPSGTMRFHEWELTPQEAAQVRDLNRYAQVWNRNGQSLLRTRYVTADLPLDTAALQQALRGHLVWDESVFQGMPVRTLYYPLGRLGRMHEPHVLQVAAPLGARDRTLRDVAILMLIVTMLVSIGSFIGSSWLAGRAVRPVHEIIDQAEEIGAGTLGRRISAYADSREYQRLVQVLNTMLARLADSFEAQRRFTADASHELRSPLTALRGEIEIALRRPRSSAEYEAVLQSAQEEVLRLSRISDDLLTLARSDAGVLEPRFQRIDLASAVRDVATRLRSAADHSAVTLSTDAQKPVTIIADADLVSRLIWNLASNAVKFTPAGGTVTLSAREADGGGVLEVADTGSGVPPDALERIFERFYQVDQVRTGSLSSAGTGLGLAIVRAIADLHGARVQAFNRTDGSGAIFHVFFPPLTERSVT